MTGRRIAKDRKKYRPAYRKSSFWASESISVASMPPLRSVLPPLWQTSTHMGPLPNHYPNNMRLYIFGTAGAEGTVFPLFISRSRDRARSEVKHKEHRFGIFIMLGKYGENYVYFLLFWIDVYLYILDR